MPNPLYTRQFEMYCKDNFAKFMPLGQSSTNQNDYSQANALNLLNKLERCTSLQLQCIKEYAQKAKLAFEQSAQVNQEYTQFFIDLEKKLKKSEKNASKSAGHSDNNAPSSYKASAPAGQSIYDSMMHTLGYDPITVGASAMFFLAFSGLRFLVGSPYWEQMAEYAANPKRQFDPKKVTEEQIAQNLDKESTREQILQAGYLPPPDLASAFEVEFKTFMQKVGHVSKQNESANLNQLGAKAVRGR